MTLATTALLMPEPDDSGHALTCPPFCDGTCADWRDRPGNLHHTSGFDTITVNDADWDISTTRSDENGQAGAHVVNLLSLHGRSELTMRPAEARQLAAMLLNAADMADAPTEPFVAIAHCTHCRTETLMTGSRRTSSTGVLRIRGCCNTCGKRQNSIVSWAMGASR